jgi:replication factor C large subunit
LMSELWTEKHSPKNLNEVVGQDSAIAAMRDWARSWEKGKPPKRALLLYGPAGTGKTISAILLAKEMGWDCLEMNASDERTLGAVRRVAGEASETGTLSAGISGRRLIIIDEADNIYGTADRGGYSALRGVIEQTRNPVILIANDLYSVPAEIRALCQPVAFRRIRIEQIVKRLSLIAQREGIRTQPEALEMIARASEGDMRSAIQDLQASAMGKKILRKEDIMASWRNREKNVFDLLSYILGSKSAKLARMSMWDVDISPEEALPWIAENIPRVVRTPEVLVRVYEAISRADIYLRRSKNSYKFWGYATDMMSAGVAVRKGEDRQFSKFQPPSLIRKMTQTMRVRRLRDSVARKLASRCHTSSRVIKRDLLPYLPAMLAGRPERLRSLAERFELSEEEVELLKTPRTRSA